MKRVVVYTFADVKEDVFDIGNHPQNEIDERASIAREERSKGGHPLPDIALSGGMEMRRLCCQKAYFLATLLQGKK